MKLCLKTSTTSYSVSTVDGVPETPSHVAARAFVNEIIDGTTKYSLKDASNSNVMLEVSFAVQELVPPFTVSPSNWAIWQLPLGVEGDTINVLKEEGKTYWVEIDSLFVKENHKKNVRNGRQTLFLHLNPYTSPLTIINPEYDTEEYISAEDMVAKLISYKTKESPVIVFRMKEEVREALGV